jgi:type I restriction enzyme M protein
MKGKGKSEAEFILRTCELLKEKGSYCIAIVPLSVAVGTKYKTEREKLMKEHTLKAVMTMPDDLFAGSGSNPHTCVMV